jgi:hypothetical protein
MLFIREVILVRAAKMLQVMNLFSFSRVLLPCLLLPQSAVLKCRTRKRGRRRRKRRTRRRRERGRSSESFDFTYVNQIFRSKLNSLILCRFI